MFILFSTILFTLFIAEMGDKTQLLMIAMTSRFKMRDILMGAALSILALNALAVSVGALINQFVPESLIKIVAALAFFYFAYASMKGEEDEEEKKVKTGKLPPVLTVFGTFFLAEFGDKTQLSAITFAATNQGLKSALVIWIACSVGLFLADLVGMLIGHIIEQKMPAGFLDKLACVIFAIFGFTTMHEGALLVLENTLYAWAIAGVAAAVFVVLAVASLRRK